MSDMKRIIRKGDRVTITYTGTLDTGEVFDTNAGNAPFTFKVGSSETILGFEEAIIGMFEGEEKHFVVPPDKGYGHSHEKLVYEVPRDQLGKVEPKVGTELVLQSNTSKKTTAKARIVKVGEKNITLDLNHPLAGKNLNFNVKVELIH